MRWEPGVLATEEGRLRLGWRLLLFVLLVIVVALPVSLIPLPGLPGQAAPLLAGSVVAGWILLKMDGYPIRALGFHLDPGIGRELGAGLALGGLVSLSGVGLIWAAGGLDWSLTGARPGPLLQAGVAALWLFLIPAAAEEALFRGYPLQALAEAWGPVWALWATSLVFAGLHLANPHLGYVGMVNLLLAGLFLGTVYLRTGSLWWATGAHLAWNWAHGWVVGLPVSGLELVELPLLDGRPVDPGWLSGGAFGPEGSVVTAVTVAAFTAWLWWGDVLGPTPAARESRSLAPLPGSGTS